MLLPCDLLFAWGWLGLVGWFCMFVWLCLKTAFGLVLRCLFCG